MDLHKDNSITFNNNNHTSNNRNLNVGLTKDDRSSISDQAFHCSASSVESLPSASGSSKYTIFSPLLSPKIIKNETFNRHASFSEIRKSK